MSAALHADINPVGFDTSYYFEYGTTTDYGQVIPISPEDIGDGTEPVSVTQTVTDLQGGVDLPLPRRRRKQMGHHARAPTPPSTSRRPTCPNDHVRQESGASYLPDCRAYELVSMTSAGSLLLFPGEVTAKENCEFSIGTPTTPASSTRPTRATPTRPSRFAYFGGLSSPARPQLAGQHQGHVHVDPDQCRLGDRASRASGQGSECKPARKECSDIDGPLHRPLGNRRRRLPRRNSRPTCSPPAVRRKGRLPTNVALIPGGKTFRGAQAMSRDFSHFVFSSNNYIEGFFGGDTAPGGRLRSGRPDRRSRLRLRQQHRDARSQHHLETPERRTDSARSGPDRRRKGDRLPRGLDGRIPHPDGNAREPADERTGLPVPPRQRRDHLRHLRRPSGDPDRDDRRAETKVFFTTDAQLVPGDTDSSVDLYQWREDGTVDGELTVLSQGNGQGNTDACSRLLGSERLRGRIPPSRTAPSRSRPRRDRAGDGRPVRGRQRRHLLLLARELSTRTARECSTNGISTSSATAPSQFVATMDTGTQVTRMQISPDGSHAAIRTSSKLTSYDTKGFQRDLHLQRRRPSRSRCASCSPTGAAADRRTSKRARTGASWPTTAGRSSRTQRPARSA